MIVEPFAGSAAYAVHHAARIDRAVLIDLDERLINLWHEIQSMTAADVDRIGATLDGERITHPLLAGMAGGTQMDATLSGKSRQVTPRMRQHWPNVRRRIVAALPYIRTWDIRHGHYTDAPDITATWFIDPPYQPIISTAGSEYRHHDIDYDHLAAWCRTRVGAVIVCDQSPAAWLPFSPLIKQANGAGTGTAARTEVIWRNDAEQQSLFVTVGAEVDTSEKDQVTP